MEIMWKKVHTHAWYMSDKIKGEHTHTREEEGNIAGNTFDLKRHRIQIRSKQEDVCKHGDIPVQWFYIVSNDHCLVKQKRIKWISFWFLTYTHSRRDLYTSCMTK